MFTSKELVSARKIAGLVKTAAGANPYQFNGWDQYYKPNPNQAMATGQKSTGGFWGSYGKRVLSYPLATPGLSAVRATVPFAGPGNSIVGNYVRGWGAKGISHLMGDQAGVAEAQQFLDSPEMTRGPLSRVAAQTQNMRSSLERYYQPRLPQWAMFPEKALMQGTLLNH